MRILILATDIYSRGGVARYTATLASALGQLVGPQNVDVLALLDWGSRDDVPQGFRLVGAVSNRVGLASKLRFTWRAAGQRRQKYDLVIANHVDLAPVAAMIRRWQGTPFWVVCHGVEVWRRLSTLKRIALRQADLVLPVSQFTAQKLWNVNCIAPSRTRMLFNAIPAAFADLLLSPDGPPTSIPPRAGNERLLLSVGGVSKAHEYKGVDMVIRTLPEILAGVPNARYVVAGGGDNLGKLKHLAAERGVARQVTFVGEVSDVELAALYRACDLFVLPSRALERHGEWTGEGFGRVYVEAALAGKPVVGSRTGGAAEAVIVGKTGLLVDPTSVSELSEALLTLLQDPDLAASMGREGRRWATERFTTSTMHESLKELLTAYGTDGQRWHCSLG
jgi:phosphatidylinositol alpha-1,6-mannosyltransferase